MSVHIDRVFPLEDAKQAHALNELQRARGKIERQLSLKFNRQAYKTPHITVQYPGKYLGSRLSVRLMSCFLARHES
ncbi:hypothetical protein PE36_20340 [Moritella sp. PE36]|nr:hypothetical protein PE36_20340 [Moritella sp. PE36]